MPRKSKLDKNMDVDLKQVPNVDIASSCSSPCKSNISVHSVDVNNNMCDSNLGLSELELKFRRRELELERALMEAQRKLEMVNLSTNVGNLNISAKVEPTISSLNLNNLNDCKENLPPIIAKATNNDSMSQTIDLPKVKLVYFDGNPLTYWKFIRQFEYYVESKVADDGQRLLYLLHYCRGRAKESIEECQMLQPSQAYSRARKILKDLYGQNFHVARSLIDNLLSDIKGYVNSGESLMRLAVKMQNCGIALEQRNYLADLNAVTTLEKIVKVPPSALQLKWAETVNKICSNCREPLFDDLTQFVFDQARILSSRFGHLAHAHNSEINRPAGSNYIVTKDHSRYKGENATFITDHSDLTVIYGCQMCKLQHSLQNCSHFLNLEVSERWNKVRQLGLCFICLKPSHRASKCLSQIRCRETGCHGRHNKLLHQSGYKIWVDRNIGFPR